MFQPIARKLFASEVFEQLKQRIVQGEVRPGAALPAERTLAAMLKVNRNAVREGLKRLEQAGLVAIRQGGATQVLDYRRHAGLELLSSLLVRPDGTIDTAVVRSVVELRSELGPVVARLATERSGTEHHAALDAIVAEMRAAKERGDDLALLARLALDFWAVVVSATGNIALELAFNSLATTYGSVVEPMKHLMADEVTATDDYARLTEALVARRPADAVAATRRIASRGQAAVLRLLEAVEQVTAKRGPTHERKHHRRPRPKRRS
ncbi:MAG: FadR/GntR family transcriptional regulator [Polyangia bacterium]